MIDRTVFSEYWTMICERHNRQPGKALLQFYYEQLSANMTTGQFRAAAVCILNTSKFFPSPVEFVAAISPDPQTEALDQWELCERVMQGERHILDRMTPEGRRVVALLGGPGALGQTHLDGVHWVRREFLAAYQTMATGTGMQVLEGPEVTPESRRIVGEVLKQIGGGKQ